jgi:hypothetical protein
MGQESVAEIIPSRYWVNPKDSVGWFVSGGELTSIVDEELRFLDTSSVDSAADLINKDYEQLLELVRQGAVNRARGK